MSNPIGFRGFTDFANSSGSTTAAVLAAARSKKNSNPTSSTDNVNKSKSIRPSPIYTGSDQQLIVLFRKIGQKRDATTKIRALEELAANVFAENSEDYTRPEKIASLCHLVFLHETKLGYDNNPSVRALSYKALVACKSHVPKAWSGLFVGEDGDAASAANTVGLAWGASRGDPSSDVVKFANEFVKQLDKDSDEMSYAIQMAILNYAKLVLGCKRASALQDVINPVSTSFSPNTEPSAGKDKKKVAKAAAKDAEVAAALAESEREEMEERYERVMLSTLIGLGAFVECHPETDNSQYTSLESFPDPASITRLMQSSRASFRRQAYNLVNRFCQFAQSLVLPSIETSSKHITLAALMPNLILAEKDSSNFVPLLELVLSYLSIFRRESASNRNPWETLDSAALVKSLSKVLRKACYGAPAAIWGQMILPIVASLPYGEDADHPLPLVVVESLWEGRKSAVVAMDTAPIVSSVVECVTFLLLRRPKDSDSTFTPQSWITCGQLFLDCLSYYLNEAQVSGGNVGVSFDELCSTISRDITRLDAASNDDGTRDRGISHNKDFFWGDSGLQKTFMSAKRDRQTDVKLTRLMSCMMESKNQNDDFSHLKPSVKALLDAIIIHSDSRGNKSCTKEEVDLILKIMDIFGAQTLFPIHKTVTIHDEVEDKLLSIEDFCVNNLIRWILIHANSAISAIPTDFSIAKRLLLSLQSTQQQKQVWETILRELIKSYCDVTTLATGLCAMTSNADESAVVDLIKCDTLDQFAIKMSNTFMDNFRRTRDLSHNTEDQDEEPIVSHLGDASLFFKTCAGQPCHRPMLVSAHVIQYWVECCCDASTSEMLMLEDEDGSNVLLDTLLLLGSSSDCTIISQDDLVKLILVSWQEGGPIYETAVKKYDLNLSLESNNETRKLRDKVISHARSSLSENIRRKPPIDHAILELTTQAWSKKAARLLEISNALGLDAVGIDVDLCNKMDDQNAAESLFLSLMYLLHDLESPSRCRELLLEGPSNQELFVHIQSSIVDPVRSFQQRTHKNKQLLEVLDGSIPIDCAQEITIRCVDLLAACMKDPAVNVIQCRRTLTALSYLVSILFPSKWSEQNTQDDCLAEDIKEGDHLWYEKTDGKRVKAVVIKIHTDDFPNLYFTIKETEENMSEERQTISNRLKRNPLAPSEALPNETEKASRELLARHITDCLVKPFNANLDAQMQNEISAECINIIVSQIGLISVGIGSVRYEIVQATSAMERDLLGLIFSDAQNFDQVASLLRFLALAMGYGLYTQSPTLFRSVSDLKVSPDTVLTSILDMYDQHGQTMNARTPSVKNLHANVAMWLTVALNEVTDGDTLRRLSSTLLSLCDVLLSDFCPDSSILALKALVAFQVSTHKCIDYSSVDSDNEISLFDMATKCFVNIQEATAMWMESFASLLKHYKKEAPSILLHASSSYLDNICECLKSSPTKRWCAFQLLMVHGAKHKPTGASEDVILSPEVKALLSQWTKNLDDEEAIELEEDMQVVTLWICEAILTLLRGISLESDERDNNNLIGDLLIWIVFLEIFDKAGATDMRNRSSMCAYLQKNNTINAIMGLALNEANLDMGRKDDIFDCICLDGNGSFEPKELATLVVFRTIESLPTLVKSWYNEDCPRYLQQKLMTFVENKVAPETLSRELARIKDATSFGEMTVTGSAVSREVMATYHQDECQLSVTIRIPPAFPLRNVEVDLGKTLGIAEKRWRRWSLNIMMMLNNQDGSILDALLLWKENVDKEFEGVEPCPVCYSVLCIKSHSMPNLQCKTCNNRFHSLCMHKWFQSSGKSNCVLCQQPWSGTKVA